MTYLYLTGVEIKNKPGGLNWKKSLKTNLYLTRVEIKNNQGLGFLDPRLRNPTGKSQGGQFESVFPFMMMRRERPCGESVSNRE